MVSFDEDTRHRPKLHLNQLLHRFLQVRVESAREAADKGRDRLDGNVLLKRGHIQSDAAHFLLLGVLEGKVNNLLMDLLVVAMREGPLQRGHNQNLRLILELPSPNHLEVVPGQANDTFDEVIAGSFSETFFPLRGKRCPQIDDLQSIADDVLRGLLSQTQLHRFLKQKLTHSLTHGLTF